MSLVNEPDLLWKTRGHVVNEQASDLARMTGDMTGKKNNGTVAVIWQRFGEYHLARLRGASEVLAPSEIHVVGVEVADSDHYEWEPTAGKKNTLFPNRSYDSLGKREIECAMFDCLDELAPIAVAINGWAVKEALAAMKWCTVRNSPAVLMSETHEPSGKWWKERIKKHRVSQFSSAIVGGKLQADYLHQLGMPKERIFVGYDAVDNEHFSTGHARESNGFSFAHPYFLANTRFIQRKNIDGLLRAYDLYRRASDTPWDLVVSGSGEMEGSWKHLADELLLSEHVHWPGFVQYHDLPGLYGEASAFVHVAHREAWGLVVNEAAAAGLPLIVGDQVGSSAELLRDNWNGRLVVARSDESIRDALLEIGSMNESSRLEYGRRSRELVSGFGPRRFGEAVSHSIEFALSQVQ